MVGCFPSHFTVENKIGLQLACHLACVFIFPATIAPVTVHSHMIFSRAEVHCAVGKIHLGAFAFHIPSPEVERDVCRRQVQKRKFKLLA